MKTTYVCVDRWLCSWALGSIEWKLFKSKAY